MKCFDFKSLSTPSCSFFLSSVKSISIQELQEKKKIKSHLWPISPPHPSTLSAPLISNSSASSGPFSSPSLQPLLIKSSSSLSQDAQGGLHAGLFASTLTPFLSTLHTAVRELFLNCKSDPVILYQLT